jgi:hypothetical protein
MIDTTFPEDRLYESDGAVLSPWGGYFFLIAAFVMRAQKSID